MAFDLTLTEIFTGAAATQKSGWTACNFFDKAIFNCNTITPQFWAGKDSCNPLPGLDPAERFDGVFSFADRIFLWGGNRLKCSDIADYSTWMPLGETVSSVHCTLLNFAVQPTPGQNITFTVAQSPEGLQTGQFMRIDWFYASNFYQVVSFTGNTITATLLNLTGVSPAGTAFAAGTAIDTLPANAAAEYVNSGDRVNGPILAAFALGDDAYIFKARSIQLMQKASISGFDTTSDFAFIPIITDEGMLGRYSWCRSTDEIIYFLGNRELYAFSGGRDVRPVATQHTKQVFAELDYANIDLVRLFHYEPQNEIWVVYPVAGTGATLRVLIYNYRWDTCSIDDYDLVKDGSVTALGAWDWQVQATWLEATDQWDQEIGTWEDEQALNSVERLTVMGLNPSGSAPSVNVYGLVYTRNGQGYSCSCETQDYDFGDKVAFKYIDTQHIALEVLNPDPSGPFRLFVQLGSRANLDSEIMWSDPQAVQVAGNANRTTKVNIRRSGRYIRARFFSTQPGVKWKISSFRISGRVGGNV